MPSPFEYAALQADQAQRLSQLLSQGFIGEADAELNYMNRIGLPQFRVVRQGDTLLGGLATLPMGQWFGGQPVPMTGIASVSIAPEARGSGAALSLMQNVLQELHQQGVALSTLYPAVQRLYRRVGYEQGGTFCNWQVATAAIGVSHPSLPIERMPLDENTLAPLAQQQARLHNGLLERHSALWQNILNSPVHKNCFAYRFGTTASPEGYLVFSQSRTEQGSFLRILDWALLTPAAVQTFWAFLAGHRSQIDQIQWQSNAVDSLSLALPEQPARLKQISRWMTRIVRVDHALAARGYPTLLDGELHLNIQDDLLPENQGLWTLHLAQGKGEAVRGGRGDLTLDIGALAALYTGLFSAYQLQNLGFLTGSDGAIALASQAFSGAPPWLADFF